MFTDSVLAGPLQNTATVNKQVWASAVCAVKGHCPAPYSCCYSLFILRRLFLFTELSSLMTLFRFPFCSSIQCYILVRKKYLLSKDETWSVLCLDLGDCVVFFL